MKSFLLKVGKLDKILKHEGFINGGARIIKTGWQYLKMLQKPEVGEVLFVAGGAMGDSTLYRAHHQKEELEIHGFKCSAVAQDNPWLLDSVKNFQVFIFHRVLVTEKIKKFITNIKNQNKEIIFDTDDLVFDLKYVKETEFFQKMNWLERKNFGNGVGGEILKDQYVKICTTTTSYLADKLREYGKKVFISKNKLSNQDMEIADKILTTNNQKLTTKKLMKLKADEAIKIGYFSGTLSHNKDFATITDALLQIMEKYPQVELFLAGPLDIESKLSKLQNRIKQFPRISREKYFANMAGVDINLAPLEQDNPFCEAKSELKFFEAGIVGVPTVAVANQTFSEAITNGLDGFLAGNTEEWAEKLEKLIMDENLRLEMGQNARETALKKYTTKNSNNEKYYNYLKAQIT